MNSPFDINRELAERVGTLAPRAADTETAGIELDLRQLWSVIYRNRLLIVGILSLALLIGAVITMLATRIYQATASVQVEQQTSKVLASDDTAASLSPQEGDRFLQTQVDILKSRALSEQVMRNLGLDRNDQFFVAMKGQPAAGTLGRLSLSASRRERIIRLLLGNLTIALPRNSRIVSVSFSSPDPLLAARIANSFAQNYIAANLQRRYDASAYARSFLEKQLSLAKRRLEDSERAANAYARRAGLLDTSAGITPGVGEQSSTGVRSLTTSNLVQINTAFIQAKAVRVAAEERWQQASRTPLLSLTEVQANPTIQQLTQQLAAAQANYEQERQRHLPDFPTMKQAAAQIEGLQKQINAIATRLRDGIREQYDIARNQEQSLAGNVGNLTSVTRGEQDRSVQYNILRRETDTNRSMYDGLLARYREVSAQAGVSSNNISLLDEADQPVGPISPRPFTNLGLAGLLGIAVAGLVMLARERFDDAIRSPDDVQRKLGLPFLNSIPLLPVGTEPLEALDQPRSSFSEAYHALRASLRLVSSNGVPNSLVFTSSREAEGKSTTSYAIARDFAQIGVRVLLIDGDLRRPSLHRVLNTSAEVGLGNVLARQANLADVVQATATTGLSFMPAGPVPPNPAELLSGQSLIDVVKAASDAYDLVVIDGPPVLGLADALLLSAAVEGIIFVVEAGRPNHGQAKAALRRLGAIKANVLGVVLTKFDPRQTGYGEEYGYYYTYGAAADTPRRL